MWSDGMNLGLKVLVQRTAKHECFFVKSAILLLCKAYENASPVNYSCSINGKYSLTVLTILISNSRGGNPEVTVVGGWGAAHP